MSEATLRAIEARERNTRGEPEPKKAKAKKAEEAPAPAEEVVEVVEDDGGTDW